MANRVQAVEGNVAPEHWRYCPRESNPAILLTRRQSLQSLAINSVWWHWPKWLSESETNRPNVVHREEREDLRESKPKTSCNVAFSRSLPSCIEDQRSQRWTRRIRITALVFKAFCLFKKVPINSETTEISCGKITAEHLEEAKVYWYKEVQQEVFPE